MYRWFASGVGEGAGYGLASCWPPAPLTWDTPRGRTRVCLCTDMSLSSAQNAARAHRLAGCTLTTRSGLRPLEAASSPTAPHVVSDMILRSSSGGVDRGVEGYSRSSLMDGAAGLKVARESLAGLECWCLISPEIGHPRLGRAEPATGIRSAHIARAPSSSRARGWRRPSRF
jgi:hypothetical protein